jgi:hypothetical protein
MTASEFNKKYSEFLEKGHYGLDVDVPQFTEWLDKKFEKFILKPGFTYSQIKEKFGMGRFYAEGLTREEVNEVETYITNLNENKKST